MKNKKYHTVGTIPKLNINIVERGKVDDPNTKIHDHLFTGTDTLINNVVVKLVL